MKKMYKTIAIYTLSVCICVLSFGIAQAKVCFVGDEECGIGGEFGEMPDPSIENANNCINAGYVPKASCSEHQFIAEYCPYDRSYVRCCGKEYSYDACIFPLISDGKCGNRYKCVCDSKIYPFTEEECRKAGSKGPDFGYVNSYPGGASCVERFYDKEKGQLTSTIKYSSCLCDRGLYPKDSEGDKQCAPNTLKVGPCTTKYADGKPDHTYYETCECDTSAAGYPQTEANCHPYLPDKSRGICIDTVEHYKSCKSCAGYNARSLEHVAWPADSKPVVDVDYEDCPYNTEPGQEMKILQCNEPGYAVNSDGSACVPVPCKDAVSNWLASQKGNTIYAIFDGRHLVDVDGNEVKNTNGMTAMIVNDISLSTTTECQKTTSDLPRECQTVYCPTNKQEEQRCLEFDMDEYIKNYGNPCHQTNPMQDAPKPCCTQYAPARKETITSHGGLGCLQGVTRFVSPRYLAEAGEITGHDANMIKISCSRNPQIQVNGTAFPYIGDEMSAPTLELYGVNLRFRMSRDTDIVRQIKIVDGNIYADSMRNYLKFKNNTNLEKKFGVMDAKGTVSNPTLYANTKIEGPYQSDGYDYEVSRLYVENSYFQNVVILKNGSLRANTMYIFGLFSLNGINGHVQMTYVGRAPDRTSFDNVHKDRSTVPYTTVTLYNTNWYMYDETSPVKDTYKMNMLSTTVFGAYDFGVNVFTKNSKILFATAPTTKYCRVANGEKHSSAKNHSCRKWGKGIKGDRTFYYIDENGNLLSFISSKDTHPWCEEYGHHDGHSHETDYSDLDGHGIWKMSNKGMIPECANARASSYHGYDPNRR